MKSDAFHNSDGQDRSTGMNRAEVGEFLVSRQEQIRKLLEARTPQREAGVAATDVVSSVIRRVDAAIERGTFVPQNHAHVWAFASTAARLLTISKAAMARRFQSLDEGDAEWREGLLASIDRIEEDRAIEVLYACAAALDERQDRVFFLLLMRGATIASAAKAMEWTPENGRRRWMGIKVRLRERFGERYGPSTT